MRDWGFPIGTVATTMVGSRVDHRNIVVDFIRDALEGARTRRACSVVRSSLPPGDAKTSSRANGGRSLPLRGRKCKPRRQKISRLRGLCENVEPRDKCERQKET